MSNLPYAESFRDLLVYQKAKALSKEIFQLTKSFPREEAYSLTDQIRRCSRSIGAQNRKNFALNHPMSFEKRRRNILRITSMINEYRH